jgi:hypothetical protein
MHAFWDKSLSVDASMRPRDARCHNFCSGHKCSIIPCHWFGPIRADTHTTRAVYLTFLEIFIRLKMSSPAARSLKGLQNNRSSSTVPSLTYHAVTNKIARLVYIRFIQLDRIIWTILSRGMTVVSILLEMSLIRRDTVLFDKGTIWTSFAAFFPNRHWTTSFTHGAIKLSAIKWDFATW